MYLLYYRHYYLTCYYFWYGSIYDTWGTLRGHVHSFFHTPLNTTSNFWEQCLDKMNNTFEVFCGLSPPPGQTDQHKRQAGSVPGEVSCSYVFYDEWTWACQRLSVDRRPVGIVVTSHVLKSYSFLGKPVCNIGIFLNMY